WPGGQGSAGAVIASAGGAVIATRLVLGRLRLRQLAADEERESLEQHPGIDPERAHELLNAGNTRVLLGPLVDLRAVRDEQRDQAERDVEADHAPGVGLREHVDFDEGFHALVSKARPPRGRTRPIRDLGEYGSEEAGRALSREGRAFRQVGFANCDGRTRMNPSLAATYAPVPTHR